MKGFSLRNLRHRRSFTEAWPDEPILQAPLAKLTWYHNFTLIKKLPNSDLRLWYARHAAEHGRSHNVLIHRIESGLRARLGKAVTNFERALLSPGRPRLGLARWPAGGSRKRALAPDDGSDVPIRAGHCARRAAPGRCRFGQ